MSDPHAALLRALVRRHPNLRCVSSRSEPWASVTFTGERHVFAFAPTALPAGLDEAELVLPGHYVADLSVASRADALIIEALTIVAV